MSHTSPHLTVRAAGREGEGGKEREIERGAGRDAVYHDCYDKVASLEWRRNWKARSVLVYVCLCVCVCVFVRRTMMH